MLNSKKYSKEKIYREILERFDYEKLFFYICHNKALQLKCQVPKLNRKICTKKVIIEGIMDLYPKISKIENYIIDSWHDEVEEYVDIIDITRDIDQVEEYIESDEFKEDEFVAATILWFSDDEKLNELGDKYCEIYYKKVDEQNMFIEDLNNGVKDKDMENVDFMNMKLGDCFNLINTYKVKYQEATRVCESREKELGLINKKLDEIIKQSKEKNKELNEINQKIAKLENNIKSKNNDELIKKVTASLEDKVNSNTKGNEKILKSINEVIHVANKGEKNYNELEKNIKKYIKEELSIYIKEMENKISDILYQGEKLQNNIIQEETVDVSEKAKDNIYDETKNWLDLIENTLKNS